MLVFPATLFLYRTHPPILLFVLNKFNVCFLDMAPRK